MEIRRILIKILGISLTVMLSACFVTEKQPEEILVRVIEGTKIQEVSVSAGNDIYSVLDELGIVLGELDSVSPPSNTRINKHMEISIIRGSELIEVKQIIIPYDRQELPNESMALGEVLLIQAGKNGLREQRVRHIYQDGKEVSTVVLSEEVISETENEIVMVGVLSPFQTLEISGSFVYINSGNAWIMENSTSNRRPLITTGDLDGRIFSLSPDGKWLLFSRKSSQLPNEEINTLWIVDVSSSISQEIELHVSNVIHFAGWQPGQEYNIAYSTVEPRDTPPGWQANNDLYFLSIDSKLGEPGSPSQILDNSSGGVYGWWGTYFSWSPDGTKLVYSRPDSIGLVNIQNGNIIELVDIIPYTTYSDWAWIPGISWSQDGNTLYFVSHSTEPGISTPEISPIFDLHAYQFQLNTTIHFVSDIGMFSYPIASLPHEGHEKEHESYISFMKAIFPRQSDHSRYRVNIIDRDGSEEHVLFPKETSPGIHPQNNWGAWAPGSTDSLLALLYEGNLWMIDIKSGVPVQITGDGLTINLDWK